MLLLALAAQLIPARPTGYPWFSSDDMPSYVAGAGRTRYVLTRTTVRPDGSILRCEIEQASGDRDVDVQTCAIITKRGKFSPAKSPGGTPSYGVFRKFVVYTMITKWDERNNPVDLDLTVDRLPKGVRSGIQVQVMFEVSAEGQISSCAPDVAKAIPPKFMPLVTLACQQVAIRFKALPATDDNGTAVASIQEACVRFTKD
ncbi:MAG: energy transducer TonB [Pseudolabrys sp.]|nr:energy transducer TonB [Pseudolabrys sp.]MBW0006499.1 energy transducer TonB [Sphingomonas sp.]